MRRKMNKATVRWADKVAQEHGYSDLSAAVQERHGHPFVSMLSRGQLDDLIDWLQAQPLTKH